MWLLGLVVGLLLGMAFGHQLWPIWGAVGALAGWAVGFKLYPEGRLGAKIKALSSELQDLKQRLESLEARALRPRSPEPPLAPQPAVPQPVASPASSFKPQPAWAVPEAAPPLVERAPQERSEERRVGKEWGTGGR